MVTSIEPLAREDGRCRISLFDPTREYEAHRTELLAACQRVLGRMQLLGGEEQPAFETEMAAYLGTRRACGVASGTDALWLAVSAAGLRPGDEVLLQANAFVAAVEALHRAGVTPVPVDIRLSDLGPEPGEIEARLGPRTRGILVVHLHGLPVDLYPILAIARGRGLIVIEDCSHWLTPFGEPPPLPNAERAAAEMLSLPVHPDLTDAEVERVADAVAGFFRR
jgi:UDP-N-acetyl-3-dehydro-alpha-D-glucosamine 3-aminotranferase